MNKGKSQAAMEFLMTYGWALLVVIIVIAALAFFGLLNPSKFLPEKCEIAPGLTCMDFNARTNNAAPGDSEGSTTNGITILLNNGLGTPIDNVRINVTGCRNATGAYSISSGSNTSVTNIPEGTTASYSIPCGYLVANSRFRSDIIVNYNQTVEGQVVTHSKKGSIMVQVEKIG